MVAPNQSGDGGLGQRMLHLNLFVDVIGHHESAWRLPESDPFGGLDVSRYVELARAAERAKLDSLFFADHPAIRRDPQWRPAAGLEPTTLLGALAVSTDRIGLIATGSTTYSEPYDLARRFSSLDHMSHGRIGWNIVTTAGPAAARNFGRDDQLDHAERYERAAEFVDVAMQLWDSWEQDAPVGDKETGRFADIDKIHAIGHDGKHFRVAGALTLPRSPQRYPVLVQAGSSEDGRAFASRYAEAVFTAQGAFEEAQAFYTELKSRAVAAGRSPGDVLVLPGIAPIVGATEADARKREREFRELINPAYGLHELSRIFETDLTAIELDAPLPEVPSNDEIQGDRSRAALILKLARSENLSARQLIQHMGAGRGHLTVAGTPEQVADRIQQWFEGGAADGFNLMPPSANEDFGRFAEHVLPILRQRGLFRTEYEGATLRDHYGLAPKL